MICVLLIWFVVMVSCFGKVISVFVVLRRCNGIKRFLEMVM